MSEVTKEVQYSTELTTTEQERLHELEGVVERGLKTFIDVGNALMEIRESRLYREQHGTFEEYCQERWGISRPRAYQLIDAAEVVGNLSTAVDKPKNESHARPLAKLEPDQQREAWEEANETAPNGEVTREHVQKVAKKYQAPKEPNYMPIWELEQGVKSWLDIQDAPDLDPTYFLEEAQKKGRAFEALLSHLDKYRRPRRKNDVLQAVNNVLEQLRQSQERRQKSRQAVQARETQPADDWTPWNPRSLWRCSDCSEEHEADEPIAAYYSESRGRLICGRCMGVRDGMIAAPAQVEVPDQPEEVSADTSSDHMAVHYSSESDEWETPQWLFNLLDAEFDFEVDVCATPDNAKCEHFYSPEDDGLAQDWPVTACWMNPPYGREIGKWVAKAFNEATAGVTVVCLLPARTDTRWWWDYVIKGEVRFLKGRLKFGNAATGAPFPSAVVVFHKSVPIQEEKVIWWDVGEGELDDA